MERSLGRLATHLGRPVGFGGGPAPEESMLASRQMPEGRLWVIHGTAAETSDDAIAAKISKT